MIFLKIPVSSADNRLEKKTGLLWCATKIIKKTPLLSFCFLQSPDTTRPRGDGEIDGQDYNFVSRSQFEEYVSSRRFVEHGEFDRQLYGTTLDAIRTVINSGKVGGSSSGRPRRRRRRRRFFFVYGPGLPPPLGCVSLKSLSKWVNAKKKVFLQVEWMFSGVSKRAVIRKGFGTSVSTPKKSRWWRH